VIYFLFLGGLIFAAYHWTSDDAGDTDINAINVDEAALLEFMQYRSKSFDPQAARDRFFSFSGPARQQVIEQFVREEALYRRALQFGFEQGDYVIRRRLVQKMDFIAEGLAIDQSQLREEAIKQHYLANLTQYSQPATISFAHVFFSSSKHSAALAETKAIALLARLNAQELGLEHASQFGDRFPYQINYVEKSRPQVADHFGAEMAAELFALVVQPKRWQGVVQSEHGSHLVVVAGRKPAHTADFEVVSGRVLVDLRNQIKRSNQQRYIDQVIEEYQVSIDPALLAN
jgi:hypothetical protein